MYILVAISLVARWFGGEVTGYRIRACQPFINTK